MLVQIKTLEKLKDEFGSRLTIIVDQEFNSLENIVYNNDTINFGMLQFLGKIINTNDERYFNWSPWMYIELQKNVSKMGTVYYTPKYKSFKKGEYVIIRDGTAFDGTIGILDKVVEGKAVVYVVDWGEVELEVTDIERFDYNETK